MACDDLLHSAANGISDLDPAGASVALRCRSQMVRHHLPCKSNSFSRSDGQDKIRSAISSSSAAPAPGVVAMTRCCPWPESLHLNWVVIAKV